MKYHYKEHIVKKHKKASIFLWMIPLACIAIIYFSFGLSIVSGPSMEPTLKDGETLIIRKAMASQYCKCGDIAVIAPSDQANTYLIKRIIAIGVDKVTVRDGAVWVNGKALKESYLPPEATTEGNFQEVIVPQGEIFVLGDNREESTDSRELGCFSQKDIFGIVLWK
ncbi:MAG: signal peptidase I [Bacillota bacterium]|nr:signal peptidase I [Bacillota bacterium]